MRASTHGLVINIIHSLCTCTKPALAEESKRLLRLSLDEFSLPKFYTLFGISKVHNAATTAFRSTTRTQSERFSGAGDRSFAMRPPDREPLSLESLSDITEALFEIMENCAGSVPNCQWLDVWTNLSKSFAFRYNPALQVLLEPKSKEFVNFGFFFCIYFELFFYFLATRFGRFWMYHQTDF